MPWARRRRVALDREPPLPHEFEAWKKRSLKDVELEYLYVDASNFRYHQGARCEPVLCAWGLTADGKPVFLALAATSAESHDAASDFLRDLTRRGLRAPLLVGVTP